MDAGDFSLLSTAGFAFLTFSFATAVYRSGGDPGSVAFVVIAYLDLLLLFWCLQLYERAAANSPQRERLKAPVWSLTTLLTAMFAYKVAGLMPLPLVFVVWAMAAATVLGGFYIFFLHREPAAA